MENPPLFMKIYRTLFHGAMEIFRSAASLCCACADHIEWFLLGRLLQGLGESIEPVIFAMARDAGRSGDAVGGWATSMGPSGGHGVGEI